MYYSLYVILILKFLLLLLLPHIFSRRSNPSHCLRHLPRHQPSIGHYLLRIEHSITNEHLCEQRCSVEQLCSMATYNRRFHRCHLFQNNPKHILARSYRSNYAFSTYADCLRALPLTEEKEKRLSNVHCNYDLLPWQQAKRWRSLIFKSYTLIGVSSLPCQELCSSVRHCTGAQFQVRGFNFNRCRLLRSVKPWDLTANKKWTVFAKRSCYIQMNENDLFFRDRRPLCNFEYLGRGEHKHSKGVIHRLSRTSEIQCQYICSKLVNCIGIEFGEKHMQCNLLSSNFLHNDGSLDIKSHQRHHIYMKSACDSPPPEWSLTTSFSRCSVTDRQCGCQQHACGHGTCLSQRREGYYYMFCNCYQGFAGQFCDEPIEKTCSCLNGGICLGSQSGCQCSIGYSGEFCQIRLERF